VPLKNHDIFLKAARLVRDSTNNVVFLLVGDGPLIARNKRLAKDLKLDGAVIFTGWRTDIDRIMPALDILVMCSRVEGLNVSILEAMACGKPVVGTNVKGIRELVTDGKDGVLIPVGDPSSLARAILDLINNPQTAARMGLHGRRKVERSYSVEGLIDAYTRLYYEVSSQCKAGSLERGNDESS